MKQVRRVARVTKAWARALGAWPSLNPNSLRATWQILEDYRDYRAFREGEELTVPVALDYPCLFDRYEPSGHARGHYFHQDLHIAQRVFANNPNRHVDVGSRVDGFVAHVASFRHLEVLDLRPTQETIPNVTFTQADVMTLPRAFHDYADSVSCLHALEHFGLGRYGDQVDPQGYRRGLRGLGHLLRPGGVLYLSVPIGRERVEFNAHRVFSPTRFFTLLAEQFEPLRFSFVDDRGQLHHQDSPKPASQLETLHYGLGIFELRKRNTTASG